MERRSWEPMGNGWFRGPKMIDALTPDFKEYAKQSRSRYDLVEYIKTVASKLLKKNSEAKPKPR